jgi:hypothetical protein
MDYWTINLWRNSNGICYVERDLLSSLDSLILKSLFKKMNTYTRYPLVQMWRSNDLESLDHGICELKFHLQAEIRYLGCIEYNKWEVPTFHALYAFNKKSPRIKRKHMETGRSRKIEFDQSKKS